MLARRCDRRLLMLTLWTLVAGAAVLAADPPASQPAADLLKWVDQACEEGRFAEAEKKLRDNLTGPDGKEIADFAVALETLRRIRMDFALTPEQMLEKTRREIPDVKPADLDRWRQEGVLQSRTIDDKVWYFVREPSNLYRFSKEANSRRQSQTSTRPALPPSTPEDRAGFVLTDDLAKMVALAEQSESEMIYPIKHLVTYTLRVKKDHPLVKKGAKVRCWIPYPQEYRQQDQVALVSSRPPAVRVGRFSRPQRSVYFEQVIDDPTRPVEFSATMTFTTSVYYPRLDPADAQPATTSDRAFRESLAERPPHIVFTRQLTEAVRAAVGDETNPLLKARKIFLWVCENISYCSELEYSTIPNLTAKALTTRRGDCGVQAMLFITMCRAAGIPARWQSGWETLPGDWNMHDWAEFYVDPWGWLPADPSYGIKTHDDPRVREFYFGHLDGYRMIVNRDWGQPFDPPKTSYRSEPVDFQRGEIEIDGRNLYFDEWDWTFDVKTVTPDDILPPAATPPAGGPTKTP
jgi:transglutaminase-like putative cysteine protease